MTLLLLEVGFRVAGYQPIYDVYSEPEAFWARDPLLGWTLKAGARGEYIGPRPFPIQFRTPIRINSLGFRGPEIEEIPSRGVRIMLLGDSMAAGFEVVERETYAAVAERLLQQEVDFPVQVVNAAVRGYGTDQAYLLYRERARELDPDIVVYHATSNDPDDNMTLHRMRRTFGKPAFGMVSNGGLELVGHPVPHYPFCSQYRLDEDFQPMRIDGLRARAMCWAQTRLIDHSALFSFVTERIRRNPGLLRSLYDLGAEDAPAGGAPGSDQSRLLTSALIRELGALADADGALFILMGQDSDLEPLDLEAFRDDGIDVVHLDEALGPHPGEDVRFPVDGHYRPEGHLIVGRLLARELSKLLPR